MKFSNFATDMLTKTKAIVLHSLRYNDSKVFVTMFCDDYGTLTFMYKQNKGKRPSILHNIMQPMNIVEVEFDYQEKKNILPLHGAQLCISLKTIPFSPYKISIVLFISELLKYALQNEQRNPQLFLFLSQSIEWLDTAEKDYASFHIVFMLRLTAFIGIMPNVDSYTENDVFDLREGRFTSLLPSHTEFAEKDLAKSIMEYMSADYNTLIPSNRKERNNITVTLLTYYRLHLPQFPELKSFKVMQELFC